MKNQLILFCLLASTFAFGKSPKIERVNQTLSITHIFSNPIEPDTFKLVYNQNNLEDEMTFQIINSSEKTIYSIKFPGLSFYGYDKPSYEFETDANRKNIRFQSRQDSLQVYDSLKIADIQYLKAKIKVFFANKKFEINPVPELYKKYRDSLYKGQYEDLLTDDTVVGFSYSLFAGGGEMIAYSRLKKKVVLFWGCC